MASDYDKVTAFMATHYDLRPSNAPPCPRIVVGKRCRANQGEGRCVCTRYYPRLFDHCRIWIDSQGRHVLTGEPYDFNQDDLKTFLADPEVTSLGLQVAVSSESPWYPGYTTLIIMRRVEP